MSEQYTNASRHIATDLPCANCGYNLRTQAKKGRCPECNLSISISLEGSLLIGAPREWLRIVRFAVSLLAASTIITVAWHGLSLWPGTQLQSQQNITRLLQLVILCAGTWCLTWPRNSAISSEPRTSLRRITRFLACVCLVVGIAFQIFARGWPTFFVMFLLSSAAYVVYDFVRFRYLWRLALRMPDQSLASETSIIMWGLIATTVLHMTGIVILSAIMRDARGGPPTWWFPLRYTLVAGNFGFNLWTLRILWRYYKRLGAIMRERKKAES